MTWLDIDLIDIYLTDIDLADIDLTDIDLTNIDPTDIAWLTLTLHYLSTVFFLPHRFITAVHFSEVKVVIGKIQSCLFKKIIEMNIII